MNNELEESEKAMDFEGRINGYQKTTHGYEITTRRKQSKELQKKPVTA
jgi:hypothetical protein